jgi:hypothetical protein
MFIYNLLTTLPYTDALPLLLLEIVVSMFVYFIFRPKLTKKSIAIGLLISLVLSLISLIVVRGMFSGMTYWERFGWPVWFYQAYSDGKGLQAFESNFDLIQFVGNTLLYAGLVAPIVFIMKSARSKNQKLLGVLIAVITILALMAGFSLIVHTRELGQRIELLEACVNNC